MAHREPMTQLKRNCLYSVRILNEEKPQQGRPVISQDANETFVSEKWQKVNCVPRRKSASFKKPQHCMKLGSNGSHTKAKQMGK